jgi:hypothetical protein
MSDDDGLVYIEIDSTPPKPPYGTPERAEWDATHDHPDPDPVEFLVANRWQPDRTDYVPGSTHDRLCSGCGRFVVLARPSRALLSDHPNVRVLCVGCLDSDRDVADLIGRFL